MCVSLWQGHQHSNTPNMPSGENWQNFPGQDLQVFAPIKWLKFSCPKPVQFIFLSQLEQQNVIEMIYTVLICFFLVSSLSIYPSLFQIQFQHQLQLLFQETDFKHYAYVTCAQNPDPAIATAAATATASAPACNCCNCPSSVEYFTIDCDTMRGARFLSGLLKMQLANYGHARDLAFSTRSHFIISISI